MSARIPVALLSLAALLAPLWVLPVSYESFLLPKTVLLFTLSAAAAAAWLIGAPRGLSPATEDARVRSWVVLLASFALSYVLSPWRAAGTEEFALASSWVMAGLVAALSVRTPRELHRLAAAAGLAGVAAAAWSLCEGPASPGLLGNPSFVASYLAGVGPLLLWLSASQPWPAGAAWTAGLALAAAALAGSGCRGAWLAALASWPLAGVAVFRAAGERRRRWGVAAAAAGALALAGAAVSSGPFIVARAAAAARADAPALRGRLLMWRVAGDMIRERPLTGQGPGGYYYRHLEHQARLLEEPARAAWLPYWRHTHSAHDAYLNLTAETGALGLAAFLAVVAAAYRGWRRRRSQEPALDATLRDAWACAALALLVDGLLGLTLQLPASALLLALALASASAPAPVEAPAAPGRADDRRSPLRLAAAVAATLLLILGAARLWLRQAAEIAVGRAMTAVFRQDLAAGERELRRAAALSPSDGRAQFFLGNVLLLSGRPDAAASRLEAAAVLLSDPNVSYDLGLSSLGRGDDAAARRWTLAALRLKPAFPEALATLGDLSQRQGRLTEAEAWFRRSLVLAPGNPAVVRELGLLCARLGRRKEAIDLLVQVNRLFPDDAAVAAEIRALHPAAARSSRGAAPRPAL